MRCLLRRLEKEPFLPIYEQLNKIILEEAKEGRIIAEFNKYERDIEITMD